MMQCDCSAEHEPRRVVLTGGPGAGKTAVLEMVRWAMCRHVRVLPEAAGMVFGGGFPREEDVVSRQAAQRAIYHVQRELEVVGALHNPAIVLCDRGTVDGLAYWPGDLAEFWASTGTTLEAELDRYASVIHLRTPGEDQGYNNRNPLRTESAAAAAEVDARIVEMWSRHPRRHLVEATGGFLDKALVSLHILQDELPDCCSHDLNLPWPDLRGGAGAGLP